LVSCPRTSAYWTRPDQQAALVAAKDQTISLLREQLEAERTANRENRRLLAAALERIPEISAPEHPSEACQGDGEGPGVVSPHPAGDDAQRHPSWWRRLFLGEA
jgi:hypothetical protein